MNQWFNADSIFFRGMSKVFDLVILSTVFTLCCLPIVTIGPSISALYYSSVKCLRRGRGYVLQEFFRAFKRDFKQAFWVEAVLLIMGYILYIDLRVSIEVPNYFINSLRYVYMGISILAMLVGIYAFPLISRFQLSLKALLQLSLIMTVRYIVTTIVSAILLFGAFVAIYMSLGVALVFVPAVTAFLISIMMEKHLKACMKMVDREGSEENKDEWYLE